MALPTGFNSRQLPGRRSFRFFASDTATTIDFADKGFLFTANGGASSVTPLPVVTPQPDSPTPSPVTVPTTPTGQGQNDPNSPVPLIWCSTLRIMNDGAADLEFSFDGVTTHGLVKSGEELVYRHRYESGIAFRSPSAVAVPFRVEAW